MSCVLLLLSDKYVVTFRTAALWAPFCADRLPLRDHGNMSGAAQPQNPSRQVEYDQNIVSCTSAVHLHLLFWSLLGGNRTHLKVQELLKSRFEILRLA